MLKRLLTAAALAAATWAGASLATTTAAEAHGWNHHHHHCRDNMCYYWSPWHNWHHWRSGYDIEGEPWWVWQNPDIYYPRHYKHHKKHHHHRWYGTHCWMTTDWHHHIPYDVKVCKTVYP